MVPSREGICANGSASVKKSSQIQAQKSSKHLTIGDATTLTQSLYIRVDQ